MSNYPKRKKKKINDVSLQGATIDDSGRRENASLGYVIIDISTH